MKTAIILHGMPSKKEYFNPNSPAQSNKHWIPWVQRQLILKGILAQTPEWPEPYAPDYYKWLEVFEQFKVSKDTLLIGYSCGAGFLVRWLTENSTRVGKVVLVAPFIDPNHNEVKSGFFDFEMKLSRAKARGIFLPVRLRRTLPSAIASGLHSSPALKDRSFL